MSKDLEKHLADAEALVRKVREELAASKELKPYDWRNEAGYMINTDGKVYHWEDLVGKWLFHFGTRTQAKTFAHKLKILSCINNLKKTLGCDWEYTSGERNYSVFYDHVLEEWRGVFQDAEERCLVYFKDGRHSTKVAKYLNKHYPNGWSLPTNTESA